MSAGGTLALVVGAFLAYLAAPGTPDSAFSGPPLSLASLWLFIGCLVMFALIGLLPPARRVSIAWAVALVALAALKVGVSRGVTPEGWRGVYAMVDDPRIDPVPFIEGFTTAGSRVDRRLDFEGVQFNLGFYNDMPRYGQVLSPTPREVGNPFEVQWTSFFRLDAPGSLGFTLRCRGLLVVEVDGEPITTDPCPNGSLTFHPLRAGEHVLSAHYTKPRDVTPLASVVPETAARLTAAPLWPKIARREGIQVALCTLVSAIACGLIVVAIGMAYRPWTIPLAAAIRRQYAPLAALGIFAWMLVAAVQNALPFRQVTTFLWSGDDAFAYESFSRDIALHGLLNANGAAIGHGDPFYFYPFYPYALAGAHRLLGDDISAAVLFNGICVSSMIILAWVLVLRRLPGWAAVVGLGLIASFCLHYYEDYTVRPFTDAFYLPLVFLAIWASVVALRRWTWWAWGAVGCLAALAAATRPSFMTYPGIFAMFVLLGWRARDVWARVKASTWLVLGFGVAVSPFTLRNWIVAHKFVLLVWSWIQIPYFLEPPDEPHKAHQVAGLIEALQQAAQIVAANPTAAFVIELRKLGFTIGWLTLGPAGQPPHPEFVVVTGLFVLALLLRRVPGILAFVLLAFAASHVAALVLAAPWTAGFKTILPLQVACLLGATLLLARVKDDVSARV